MLLFQNANIFQKSLGRVAFLSLMHHSVVVELPMLAGKSRNYSPGKTQAHESLMPVGISDHKLFGTRKEIFTGCTLLPADNRFQAFYFADDAL